MSKAPEGYIEVGERIQKFYERYPEGSLRSWHRPYLEHVGEKTFVVYAAAAYRTPDDDKPGIGYAWEPVPGPTPFTKDSELMNAETSAWGRAIAALGFETREHVASANEVRARTGNGSDRVAAEPSVNQRKITQAQQNKISAVLKELEEKLPTGEGQKSWQVQAREMAGVKSRSDLTVEGASALIDWLEAQLEAASIPF